MAYEEKTDWLPDDPINEDDVNRWEKGIKDAHTDLAAHKNDMNNPHNTTKAQVGLGNVDDVQQAAKKDFELHVNDDTIHITATERSKWNNAQLSKISGDDGRVFYKSVNEITDYNDLTDTGMYLIYNDGLNGPGLNMCFLLVMSYKNTLVQIAYDGFKGEQSFFRIRKNDSTTWTAWIESETTEGSQKKIDAHANKTDIHVSKSDKDKWNDSQLFKITQDNGVAKYRKDADFNTITETGFYYMSGVTTALNAPVDNNGYLMVYNYSTYAYQEYTSYSSSDTISTGRRKFMRNKVANSDTWTSWREIESVEGSQIKVDAHANLTDIHVTKSDKDKWNNAQLYKLTDTQGCRTKIPDGTDLLTLPSGFYYALGNVIINNPVSGDGSWYNYDVIETGGGGGRKTILASRSYDGTFWTATVHTDGVFKGWNKIETEASAQIKADKAFADAKNYVDKNYTNQKLTVLTGSNAIQDARTGGTDYPSGITFMDIGANNTTGYPLTYGFVKNEKHSNYRFTQYFYGNADTTNGSYDHVGSWIRHWWADSGWTAWQKISGFAHANIGTTGKQLLTKGESQKVNFNRKIKDSHNCFDPTNNRFVVPNDGMYLVNAGIYIENYLEYANYETSIYVNGSRYKNIAHYRISPSNPEDNTNINIGIYGAATVSVNKGDYIEIYLYVGYNGQTQRYITDSLGWYNYFDITEIGGQNYPVR
ncbi:pyocin knob domain-containing protein [Bacillus halotolerans]|uniref:pyocin knob domain-containing protein n=1 Tax=Bacillus halotolerans TaxID=260554 RepID=UPI003D9A4E5C